RQSRCIGDLCLLGGNDGVVLIPIAILGVTNGVPERSCGGGQHRINQLDRKPRRIPWPLRDWLPLGPDRWLHSGSAVSGRGRVLGRTPGAVASSGEESRTPGRGRQTHGVNESLR